MKSARNTTASAPPPACRTSRETLLHVALIAASGAPDPCRSTTSPTWRGFDFMGLLRRTYHDRKEAPHESGDRSLCSREEGDALRGLAGHPDRRIPGPSASPCLGAMEPASKIPLRNAARPERARDASSRPTDGHGTACIGITPHLTRHMEERIAANAERQSRTRVSSLLPCGAADHLHDLQKLHRVDRLVDVVVHPRLQAPFAVALHRMRRQGDNRSAAAARFSRFPESAPSLPDRPYPASANPSGSDRNAPSPAIRSPRALMMPVPPGARASPAAAPPASDSPDYPRPAGSVKPYRRRLPPAGTRRLQHVLQAHRVGRLRARHPRADSHARREVNVLPVPGSLST